MKDKHYKKRGVAHLLLFLLLLPTGLLAQGNQVEILDTLINSSYDELNPVINPEGTKLYFTRANHPENIGGTRDKGDIWVAEKQQDGNWGKPKNLGGPLNNKHYNAVVGFSANGQEMYLNHHYYKDDDKFTRGISVSKKRGDQWSFPEKVPVKYLEPRSEYQSASLAANGKIMLIAMESYANYGIEDIYVSFLQSNGAWTSPENLGMPVNTKYQEFSPYLLSDNKTLIFSSNGHDGFGSMDLFYSIRQDDTWKNWSKPQNMGKEVNSKGRETYYTLSPDKEFAYFSTTRNSEGYGDLRRMKVSEEDIPADIEEQEDFEVNIDLDVDVEESSVEEITEANTFLTVFGKVIREKTNEPVAAKVTFNPINTGDESGIITDSVNGSFQIRLPSREDYMVDIAAKGYMNAEEKITVGEGQSSIRHTFILTPLEVGRTFRLENVLFHRGTTNLIDSSFVELDQVAQMMTDNPGIEIELGGHTDNRGSSRLNMKLSRERVERVKQYLVEKGIDADRIEGKGYGGSRPIASNKNEETRRLNRRVEFTILRNNDN